MNYTSVYKEGLKSWLFKDNFFDYMLTFRPKKSKITIFNANRVFSEVFKNTPNIKTIYYAIESDYNRNCNHAHILVEGKDLYRDDFKTKRINPSNEIPYFAPIESREGVINYVTKHIGKQDIYVRGHDILYRDKVEQDLLMDNIHKAPLPYYRGVEKHDVPKQVRESFEHPNKEYHDKAEHLMNLFGNNRLVKYPYS